MDVLHFVWFWLDHGTGFGSVVIWASGCLVGLVSASEILGLPGLASCWLRLTEFIQGAKWSGYSWVIVVGFVIQGCTKRDVDGW